MAIPMAEYTKKKQNEYSRDRHLFQFLKLWKKVYLLLDSIAAPKLITLILL